MAGTVKNVALFLQATVGKDFDGNNVLAIPCIPDYFSRLRSMRIGITRNAIQPFPKAGPKLVVFKPTIRVMERAGAIVVDCSNYTESEALENSNRGYVLGADFTISLLPPIVLLTNSGPYTD